MREEIKTARLLLRRFRESDYDDLFEFLSQLEDDEFEGYPGITYDNGREHLRQRLGSEEFYAVELPDSGKVIGNIYSGARDFAAKEVGYIINKDYQRQGCAAEALSAVIRSAFQEGAHRVYAECDPRNTASWKLLESLGFRREAHLRQNVFFQKDDDGVPIWKDTYVYAILESDETNKLRRESVEEKILETERLFLREVNEDDYDALYSVLADSDIMQHYPYTFDEKRVRGWIAKNIDRYRILGFGLWAVCLKESGEMIGDCGLTMQNINGNVLPEIGYHIRMDFQRRGYAKEAAKAVRDWVFRNTDYPALYSYCKYTNEPSVRTAESIGMHFDCEYPDEANGITRVSVISKEDWLRWIGAEVINQQKEGLRDGV